METIWLHGKDNNRKSVESANNSRPCKFWRMYGNCRRGSDCEFSHEGPPGSPLPIKDKICRYWAERGLCAKGSACDFSHDIPPPPRDLKVCKFWIEGRCQKGMDCSFRHPVLGPDPPGKFSRPPAPLPLEIPREIFDRDTPQYGIRGGKFSRGRGGFDDYGPRRGGRRGGSAFLERKPRPRGSTLCKFFQNGNCDRGEDCGFSHQPGPKSEKCKFWGHAPCFKGEWCPFLHVGPGIEEQEQKTNRESSKRKRDSERNASPSTKRMKKETNASSDLEEQDDVWDFGKASPAPAAAIAVRRPRVEIGTRDIQKEEQLDVVLEKIDMKLCLEVAIKACKACGDRICVEKDNLRDREEKLSELEEECNTILATAIASKYPLHAIVGKQNVAGHTAITSAPTWFIASIDGIDNLVRGSTSVCVSIGLCVERRPVLGVIFNPLLDNLVAAYRGGGVILNESKQPIELENSRRFDHAVIVSELCKAGRNPPISKGLTNMLAISSFSGYRASGSYNQNFMDVLQGLCDGGFQERAEGPWNICAGVTVMEEAGGVATDLKGNLFELSMDKQEVIYGPKELVQEMLRYF